MNYNNILHSYGPLLEIDFTKVKLLIQLNNLNADISEEKFLHQHICINVLPTPYKVALGESKQDIENYKQKIYVSDNIDDVVALDYAFNDFKQSTKKSMKVAYEKTVFLVSGVRNMAALTNLKGRLQKEVSQRVKDAIAQNSANHTDNHTSHKPQEPTSSNIFVKQNITHILASNNKQDTLENSEKKLEKTIEDDLLYCVKKLLRNEWEQLKDHFYFIENPEYLREYKQTQYHLNEKTTMIFLVLQAKKIVTQNPDAQSLEIYDKFFKFFGTLMNYDKYHASIAHGVQNLKNYVTTLNNVRHQKENLESKNIYTKLKEYLNKPPQDV